MDDGIKGTGRMGNSMEKAFTTTQMVSVKRENGMKESECDGSMRTLNEGTPLLFSI